MLFLYNTLPAPLFSVALIGYRATSNTLFIYKGLLSCYKDPSGLQLSGDCLVAVLRHKAKTGQAIQPEINCS